MPFVRFTRARPATPQASLLRQTTLFHSPRQLYTPLTDRHKTMVSTRSQYQAGILEVSLHAHENMGCSSLAGHLGCFQDATSGLSFYDDLMSTLS